MKIIQITAVSTTVKAFLLPLIEKLSEKGHELIVITSDGIEDLKQTDILKKNNVKVYQAPIPRTLSPTKLLKAYQTLIKQFKELKPDVVHTHTPVASLLARKAATKAKVPQIIYTCHGFYFHENMQPLKKKLFTWLEKNAAQKNTDYIFTVNQEDMDFAIENDFIQKDKILNINSVGINTTTKFNPALFTIEAKQILKKELNLNQTDKIITFIGRLVAEKGIIELIEAFSLLKKQRNDVKLLMIGETLQSDRDKKAKDIIKQIIQTNNLENDILFTGFRTDIANLLSITDVFVLPSHREGMPVSSLEAMSMGVPVVGTNIRGLREEIIEDKTGFIVPLQNPEKLSAAINKSLNQFKPPEENIRNHIIENFDEKKVLERQLKVFEEIEKNISPKQKSHP